jgi:two-component system, NtrC family, nitrogen regulation response regulator GlnG
MNSGRNAENSELSTMSSRKHSQRQGGREVLALRVLCHPDLSRVDETAVLFDDARTGSVRLNRKEPMFRAPDGRATSGLASARVSRRGLTFTQEADGSLRLRADGADSVWICEQPAHADQRLSRERLAQGMTLRLGSYVLLWLGFLDVEPEQSPLAELCGGSACMRELRREILRVADLSISVLLRGETGVGKELVANALHRNSPRAKGPLVSVNMAAVPAPMAASELFGHVKGAFTGASAPRRGYFAEAQRGTLFLDEIGETASDVQPMLLRALEQGVIQPLGGKPEQVDVRVVAATDSNLEAAVALGRFKAPLLRRFGYEIYVPPLRARREDIGGLFVAFLRREHEALGGPLPTGEQADQAPFLPADFVARLVAHDWPGNVRELLNLTRRFAVHNRGRARASINAELLRLVGGAMEEAPAARAVEAPGASAGPRKTAAQLSDEDVARALQKHAYVLEATAAELGVSRSWLHKHLNDRPTFRKAKDLSRDEIERALAAHGADLSRAALALSVSPRGLRLRISQYENERGKPGPARDRAPGSQES